MSLFEKDFDYLNLEIKNSVIKRSIDEKNLRCFAEGNHKHRYHSDHTHLNLISDYCSLLLLNHSLKQKSDTSQFRKILDLLSDKSSILKTFSANLEYIKSQQDLSYLKKLPTKGDIQLLIQKLNFESIQIEKDNQQNLWLLNHKITELEKQITDLSDLVLHLEEKLLDRIEKKLDRLLS